MSSIRIRKNASKKIHAYLDQATAFKLHGQTMGLDDCHYKRDAVTLTREKVLAWMDENYSSLLVELVQDSEGKDLYLSLLDGPYYFSDEIRVEFRPQKIATLQLETSVAVKPRMTLKAVQAFLAQGFSSPLNHGGKTAQDGAQGVKSIIISMSEARELNQFAKQPITLGEYHRAVWAALSRQRWDNFRFGHDYCDKTFAQVTLNDGSVLEVRHDVHYRSRDLLAVVNRKKQSLLVDEFRRVGLSLVAN